MTGLRIDAEQRKISLSLKAALPKEEPKAPEEEEVEEEVKPPRPRTTPLRGASAATSRSCPCRQKAGRRWPRVECKNLCLNRGQVPRPRGSSLRSELLELCV